MLCRVVATCLVLIAMPVAAQAQNAITVFVSSANPGPLPTPNPGHTPTPPEFNAQTDPSLTATSRLYLWAAVTGGVGSSYWSICSFNIDLDGPATMSNLTLFNPSFSGQGRWSPGGVIVPALDAGGTEYNNVLLLANAEYGVRRVPYTDGYAATQPFPLAGAPVLLGYFDVNFAQTGIATVWLEFGPLGFDSSDGVPAQDTARFGFASASLPSNSGAGTRSTSPVATFNLVAPGPFSLFTPAGGAYVTSSRPDFVWDPAPRAQTYTLYVDNNADFSSPEYINAGNVFASHTPPPGTLTSGVWYWRVIAVNTGGQRTSTPGSRDLGVIVGGGGGGDECRADFDGDGNAGVPDIFLFLAEWFAGCP